MKTFTSISQKIGELGETIACKYLIRGGFDVMERNYTRKCGEIDIIARREGTVHFIEVKSVSCESFAYFSRETDMYRPEEKVHIWKRRRLIRTIRLYLATHSEISWQFDVVCVFLNQQKRIARVKVLENVILE